MEYSEYPSNSETRYRLSVSYNDTFNLLIAPENQSRFTDKEKDTFEYIKNNYRIETENPSSVDIWKLDEPGSSQPLAFDFHATPGDLLEAPKVVTDFTSAHEIKHASLAYNQYVKGVLNIHSFVIGSGKIYEGISDLQNKLPDISFITTPLAYGAKLIHAAFQRQEERICDRFALRVYPNADINQQKAFRQKRDNELLTAYALNPKNEEKSPSTDGEKRLGKFQFAIQNLKEIVGKYENDHPDNDSRYSSLLKIKNQRKF